MEELVGRLFSREYNLPAINPAVWMSEASDGRPIRNWGTEV